MADISAKELKSQLIAILRKAPCGRPTWYLYEKFPNIQPHVVYFALRTLQGEGVIRDLSGHTSNPSIWHVIKVDDNA